MKGKNMMWFIFIYNFYILFNFIDIFFVDENGDEESEDPPKPEVKEVKEDDAFYSKK